MFGYWFEKLAICRVMNPLEKPAGAVVFNSPSGLFGARGQEIQLAFDSSYHRHAIEWLGAGGVYVSEGKTVWSSEFSTEKLLSFMRLWNDSDGPAELTIEVNGEPVTFRAEAHDADILASAGLVDRSKV